MLISDMTYREMMVLFPIRKEFDGWKYEAKDYYSTVEWLSRFNMDEKIGKNVDEFLWNYYNQSLMMLSVNSLMVIDCIRRFEGQTSIMQDFADKMGVETYIMHEDKDYAYNTTTHRTVKVRPYKKRSHLTIIKGGKDNDSI